MDQEIISRLKKRIVAEGLDAIVASSPENVTYVSGFVVPSQSLMRWRHAAVIITADGRISMVEPPVSDLRSAGTPDDAGSAGGGKARIRPSCASIRTTLSGQREFHDGGPNVAR